MIHSVIILTVLDLMIILEEVTEPDPHGLSSLSMDATVGVLQWLLLNLKSEKPRFQLLLL